MRTVAVVPVKSISERVQSKNFREFSGSESLFSLLINKLNECREIDKIYVSTDELSVKSIVEVAGCEFLFREASYCNNSTPWSDVIAHIISNLPEDDEVSVAWCHTTSPLFDRFDEALQVYKDNFDKGVANGLLTVSRMSEFIVTERKIPMNYSWGPWHPYSQNLEKIYSVTGALFVAKKSEMLRTRYVVSRDPFLFEVTPFEAIDVDTPLEFAMAKWMFENQEVLQND